MKRKLLILSVLAICLSTLAAGTLAYFTAEDKAHNVITTGGIDITVQEWADAEKTRPFQDLAGVMPNTTVTKIAEVRNTGGAEAWVRVKVEKNIKLQGEGAPDTSLVELTRSANHWTEKDGYYYYNAVLEPGQTTEPLFTAVHFAETMSNMYQESRAILQVNAFATQTAHNGASALDAAGWPEA